MKHFINTWGDDSPLKLYMLSRIKHSKKGLTPNESAVLAMMGEPYLNPERKASVAAEYLGETPNFVYKNLYSAQRKLS